MKDDQCPKKKTKTNLSMGGYRNLVKQATEIAASLIFS